MGMENPGWMEVYSWENDLLINARFSTATFSLMKGEDWHGLITKDAGIAQPCGFVWWGLIVYISKNQNSLILIPIKLYIVCMYVYIYIYLIYLIYLAIYLSISLSLPPYYLMVHGPFGFGALGYLLYSDTPSASSLRGACPSASWRSDGPTKKAQNTSFPTKETKETQPSLYISSSTLW